MPGQNVELIHISHAFKEVTAVEDLTLTVDRKCFFSFLGPSGCGKTTLLRIIAGFIRPTRGKVLIGGKDMAGMPPNLRPTAMIFQNLALFPLMSVWENVAFAFEVRGMTKKNRRMRAEELLDRVALPDVADKSPQELSGGQRQRVAIARALAVEPEVLLLDEPLSALDLKLRQKMITELRDIQRQTEVTFIYITHDQGEALAMSDQIAVMTEGKVQQIGTPEEIYNKPRTAFVATFVGENNRIQGRITRIDHDRGEISTSLGNLTGKLGSTDINIGEDVLLFVRPERCTLNSQKEIDNSITGQIVQLDFAGPTRICNLNVKGELFKVVYPEGQHHFKTGDQADLSFHSRDALILPQGKAVHD
ncbi:MAG: ABC transporter ATP-binding protein [Gammaproteobacteria bacterium]|nr:ABC transporter ATP-binding protein [Gammaproteobacteria bacterium]